MLIKGSKGNVGPLHVPDIDVEVHDEGGAAQVVPPLGPPPHPTHWPWSIMSIIQKTFLSLKTSVADHSVFVN